MLDWIGLFLIGLVQVERLIISEKKCAERER